MKRTIALLLITCTALFACNKVVETAEESAVPYAATEIVSETPQGPAFTLNASCGSPDTRLTFDPDGLNTTWQPGDVLYLVDPARKINTVTLTTDITSPSKTASFKSQTSVLKGDYVVIYGSEGQGQYMDYSMTDLSTLNSRIRLYGSLSVQDGQTSASISLSHVFSKLSFKFKNIPTGLKDMSFGIAASKDGLPITTSGTITDNGWVPYNNACVAFSSFSWNNGADSFVLIPPADLSAGKVIFYLYGTDINNNHISYELYKNGINLKAGINYNITLDFSNAESPSTISKNRDGYYALSSPKDFRAAAYWNNSYNQYSVSQDVDFANEVYLPINAQIFNGNMHVLSNVNIDLKKIDYVGVVSNGYVKQLIVKNSSVMGYSCVGGIVGNGYAFQCGFEGNVSGKSDRVGGIAGCNSDVTDQCYVVGNVSGNKNVGGIVGGSSCTNSYIIGNVTGKGNNVAGISGGSSPMVLNCYSYCESVSTGNGIADYPRNSTENKNLTSLSQQFVAGSNRDNCNCGPNKTFLSKLSVINGDEAYSTQVWSNIDAGCPLLQWQAEGFGGDITAPGFGDEDW